MKLTIIIPVYKTEKTLDRCVESILSQDYSDYEIILVDDGSPDLCPEKLLGGYSREHCRHARLGSLFGSDFQRFGMRHAFGLGGAIGDRE